jgi:hypothetical protein
VSKEDIAECASLLAMNVAHYQSKYGELPLEEKLAMINMNKPNDEQIQLMINGMVILVGVQGMLLWGSGRRDIEIECRKRHLAKGLRNQNSDSLAACTETFTKLSATCGEYEKSAEHGVHHPLRDMERRKDIGQ